MSHITPEPDHSLSGMHVRDEVSACEPSHQFDIPQVMLSLHYGLTVANATVTRVAVAFVQDVILVVLLQYIRLLVLFLL